MHDNARYITRTMGNFIAITAPRASQINHHVEIISMNVANHLRVGIYALLVVSGPVTFVERSERTCADGQFALPKRHERINIVIGEFRDGLLLFREVIGRPRNRSQDFGRSHPRNLIAGRAGYDIVDMFAVDRRAFQQHLHLAVTGEDVVLLGRGDELDAILAVETLNVHRFFIDAVIDFGRGRMRIGCNIGIPLVADDITFQDNVVVNHAARHTAKFRNRNLLTEFIQSIGLRQVERSRNFLIPTIDVGKRDTGVTEFGLGGVSLGLENEFTVHDIHLRNPFDTLFAGIFDGYGHIFEVNIRLNIGLDGTALPFHDNILVGKIQFGSHQAVLLQVNGIGIPRSLDKNGGHAGKTRVGIVIHVESAVPAHTCGFQRGPVDRIRKAQIVGFIGKHLNRNHSGLGIHNVRIFFRTEFLQGKIVPLFGTGSEADCNGRNHSGQKCPAAGY